RIASLSGRKLAPGRPVAMRTIGRAPAVRAGACRQPADPRPTHSQQRIAAPTRVSMVRGMQISAMRPPCCRLVQALRALDRRQVATRDPQSDPLYCALASMGYPKVLRSLYVQVLIGIALGVILGVAAPEQGAAMRPLGDGFIKLIKMLIAPIIFCT